MSVKHQIKQYIAEQDEPKRGEMQTLHELILKVSPKCKLWFSDGKNDDGKVVSNPNIGYGNYTIHYADGSSRQFYRIGLSANKTGISVYVLGLSDKKYLAETYGKKLGKASVTGYCIKFRKLTDLNTDVLREAVEYGFKQDA